jgi:hypothetical protein
MLALSMVEGFARGVVYLHAACPERSRRAHLPVPKSLPAKSSVSISSKLIETKGLQLHHFGHLRKTGGRGSHRLVHTAYLPLREPHGTKSNHSRTLVPSAFREGYAIPGGWGVFPDPTFRYNLKCLHAGCVECRRADIFDFSHFSRPEPGAKRHSPPARLRRRPLQQRRAGWASPSPTRLARTERRPFGVAGQAGVPAPPVTGHFLPPVGFSTAVLRGYCVGPCQNGT